MAKNQFAVIGLGQFGEAIARSLSKSGAEVMAIDIDQEKVDNIANDVAYAVAMATNRKALISQNIQKFDAVVIAIGEEFEELLLCAVNLLELKIPRIIVRAKGKINRKILEKLGLTEIFSPEFEVGAVVADRLLHPTMINSLNLPDDFIITEIKAPKSIIGQSIEAIKLRESYGINLVTIKKEIEELEGKEIIIRQHIKGVPNRHTVIEQNDAIIIFGNTKDIEKFIEINS